VASEGDQSARTRGRRARYLRASQQPIELTPEFDHLPPHHYLRLSNTSMDLRKKFLKPFKKAKQKLTESHRKQDGRSGSEGDREGRGTDVGGSETGQKNPRLHSEVESVVENGPSREENDVGGESDSM
jgi:hypothetical protein